MDMDKLTASIEAREGTILHVYDDANGKPIVKGYTVIGTPTIGSGINLCTGITQIENTYLTSNRILSACRAAEAEPWWPHVCDNDARSRAMCEIAFNIGIVGLRGFKTAISCLLADDFAGAGAAFLDSLWHAQVGKRAEILATMIINGMD